MPFLESLRRTLGSGVAPSDPQQRLQLREAWGLGTPGVDPTDTEPADPTAYDRTLWRRKLRLIFTEKLPVPEREWADFVADAQALGFDPAWVVQAQREEFEMLVRRAVADGVVTPEEHQKIDLARQLVGITPAEAVDTLQRVVNEARSLFGKEIEGV